MSGQDPELWLAQRLKEQGIDIYAVGPCSSLQERLALAIRCNNHGAVIAGRRDGKPETFAEVFARIYGVAVDAKKAMTR